jgi:hypothetical protein
MSQWLVTSYIRGGTKVMPPFSRRKYNCNKSEIYIDDSYIRLLQL